MFSNPITKNDQCIENCSLTKLKCFIQLRNTQDDYSEYVIAKIFNSCSPKTQ